MDVATAESKRISRRRFLGATGAAVLGSASGCVQRIRSLSTRSSPSTVSLTVMSPPADGNRMATLVARHLIDNLEAAGIDATLDLLPKIELYRQVYFNRNFELFVAPLPVPEDPQLLQSLTYSTFAEEPGLQNPYGFSDLTTDELIDGQRMARREERRGRASTLLDRVTRDQPFTTVIFPEQIRAVRTDQFVGWEQCGLERPLCYLTLDQAESATGGSTLTLAIRDTRITENLNPLAIEFRQPYPFTSLVYDPLVRRFDGDLLPWLAREWEYRQRGAGGELHISLREGLDWQDGHSITAADVVFTFQFLQDTSLGSLSHTVPAPKYREFSVVVDDAWTVDEHTAVVSVTETGPDVAEQLLTATLFPKHIWSERTDVANFQGIEGSESATEAIITTNDEPVGSGPLRVTERSVEERVVMEPYEEHFLRGEDELDGIPEPFIGGPAFDRLELEVVPSNEAGLSRVAEGEFDGTATGLDPREEILDKLAEGSEFSKLVERAGSPLQIGYNTRIEPFSNPHFRRTVARLIDKQYITDYIFEGYGQPVASPFEKTTWGPDHLRFNGTDPELPFLGTDGEVDVERVREEFREQGFEFDSEGSLIQR